MIADEMVKVESIIDRVITHSVVTAFTNAKEAKVLSQ